MKTVIQRVSSASIETASGHKDSMGLGLVVLIGIEESDGEEDIEWLSGKISRLRIFNDSKGDMNLSLKEVNGDILLVSQFTLHALVKKGNRPSFIKAAKPEIAIPIYEKFIQAIGQAMGKKPKTGIFGDHMELKLVNDGPVTIIIDTKNRE